MKWPDGQRIYRYMEALHTTNTLPPDCWCPDCDYAGDHPDYPEEAWKKFEEDLGPGGTYIYFPTCPQCSCEMVSDPFYVIPDWLPHLGKDMPSAGPPSGLRQIHAGMLLKKEYVLHIFGDYVSGAPVPEPYWGLVVELHEEGTYDIPLGWRCLICEEVFASKEWPEGCHECEDDSQLVAFHPPVTDSEFPYECFACSGFWLYDKKSRQTECPHCGTKEWNRPRLQWDINSPEFFALVSSPLKIMEYCTWHLWVDGGITISKAMSEEGEVRSPDQKYPYMTLWRGDNWMPPDCWCAECDYIGHHPDFSEETRREFEEGLLSMDLNPECPKCGSDDVYVEPYDASPVYDPTEGGLHSGIRKRLEYSLRIPWLEYEYKRGQTIHCELTVRLIEEGTYDMSVGWLCDVCEHPFSSPDWPETCPECDETERLVAFHPPPTDSQNPYECLRCGAFWFGDRWERPTACPRCCTQYWNMMPPKGEGDGPRYYIMPSSPLTVLEFTYWSRFGDLT